MALTPILVGPYTIHHLPIDQAADLTAELVAAVAGCRIMVLSVHIQGTPAGTVQLLSAAQPLTADQPLADTGGFSDWGFGVLPGGIPIPVMWTEKGEALNLITVDSKGKGYLNWFYWAE